MKTTPSTTTTTTTATTTATTTTKTVITTEKTKSGCGFPDWANDNYCDDENNNEGCNFDNGACCFNNSENWDYYCEVSSYLFKF